MANIWKPNPSIAAYYDRVEATATGGRCQHCQMVSHIFRDVAYSEPFRPLVVWQHAIACPVPALRALYRVRADGTPFVESSARSRGFKFALISGLAAYVANANRIIVPESGQGALGPSLVPVGQAYEDYRSHPLFTARMEAFLAALLGTRARFEFPRLWQTKGETLRKFVDEVGGDKWASTWSCWRQNRHVSVDGRRRQCGVCAACMLRRMSVHGAGLLA